MKKRPLILIDPGHGGGDPGAVAENITEASINLRVAQQLGPLLASEPFDVHYTRYFNQSVSLADRVALADALHPDLYLSLHCNAATNPNATGFEIFTSPGQTESDLIAEHLLSALSYRLPGRQLRTDTRDGDRDKEAGFYVLKNTTCPAVLLEMGFLTNPEDCAWLLRNETPLWLSLGMIAGLLAWRGSL